MARVRTRLVGDSEIREATMYGEEVGCLAMNLIESVAVQKRLCECLADVAAEWREQLRSASAPTEFVLQMEKLYRLARDFAAKLDQ